MSNASGERGVLVLAADLVFRSKVEAVVRAAGRVPVRDGEAPLAVVEVTTPGTLERVRALAASGCRVLAFAPHVRGELLEAAAAAGAVAVPNAAVERALRAELCGG